MSKKEKDIKTNAVRIVEAKGIAYKLKTYDASGGFMDGVTVALETGTNPDKVFKTLVLVGSSKEHYVCVIPVAEELDLKIAAKHFGEKKIEMIHVRDITPLTGYIKGGCSPVGMKKLYETAIDATACRHDAIYVSGGKIGMQMELCPRELCELIEGSFTELIK